MSIAALAIAAILLWNPIQGLLNPSSASSRQAAAQDGEKAVSGTRPDKGTRVPATPSNSGKNGDAPAAVVSDQAEVNADESEPLASPIYAPEAMRGPYQFYTEVLEVTENGVVKEDPEQPVGQRSSFPVFFSMGEDNGGSLYVTGNHTPDGLPSIMTGAFSGEDAQILDIDRTGNIVTTYYGKIGERYDDLLIEGTYEEVHNEDTPQEKVVRGNWYMERLVQYQYEGVDIAGAFENLSWTDVPLNWSGTVTYTNILNLDEAPTYSEADKARFKGYLNTPLNADLQLDSDNVQIVIHHPDSDIVTTQNFSPVDTHEGVLYARDMDDFPDLHTLGGAFIREGRSLRFEACYTRLVATEGNPVIMTMFISASPSN